MVGKQSDFAEQDIRTLRRHSNEYLTLRFVFLRSSLFSFLFCALSLALAAWLFWLFWLFWLVFGTGSRVHYRRTSRISTRGLRRKCLGPMMVSRVGRWCEARDELKIWLLSHHGTNITELGRAVSQTLPWHTPRPGGGDAQPRHIQGSHVRWLNHSILSNWPVETCEPKCQIENISKLDGMYAYGVPSCLDFGRVWMLYRGRRRRRRLCVVCASLTHVSTVDWVWIVLNIIALSSQMNTADANPLMWAHTIWKMKTHLWAWHIMASLAVVN